MTLAHIIQSFNNRSVNLCRYIQRGDWDWLGKCASCPCPQIVARGSILNQKHCTTSLLSHILLHISILGSISEWATDLFFRLIFHKSSSCNRVALLNICTVTSNLLLQYTNKITFKYIINYFFQWPWLFDFANSNKKFWIGLAIFFCRLPVTCFSLWEDWSDFLFASNRNALHQNKQVIFCTCGMRIDTEVRLCISDRKCALYI